MRTSHTRINSLVGFFLLPTTMTIVHASIKFSSEFKDFICAVVQRMRDDEGFGGSHAAKSRITMDLDSDFGNILVFVTGGVSYLDRAVVKRLLVHGYSIWRVLIKAFDGCAGVFHTTAFVDPAGISGYSKSMAELEAKVSENVIEACTRTGSVRKCVFTSSLLACAWQNNSLNNFDHSFINEESWSDEQLCIDNELWYALGKLRAEKAAWRISETNGLKLATICPALITGPDFFHRSSTSTLAYLKGAKEMYSDGLLATMDVNRLAKAHVCLYEGLGNKTAFGRHICFDIILSKHGAEKLAKDIGVQIVKICGRSSHSDANAESESEAWPSSNIQISDEKLINVVSRTLRTCYRES